MSASPGPPFAGPRRLAADPRAPRLALALARLIERGGRLSALPGLYSTVAEDLATLVAYERLSISVFDADAGMLRIDYNNTSLLDVPPVGSLYPLNDSVAGEVFRSRKPLIHAIKESPAYRDDAKRHARGIKEIAVAPIVVDEVAYGAIAISSVEVGRYTEDDLWILTTVANLLGMMVSGITLRHEAQRKRRDAEFLARLSRLLAGKRETPEISQAIVDLLAPELGKTCMVFLATDEGRFNLAAVRAVDPALTARAQYIGTSLCELPRSRTAELAAKTRRGVPLVLQRKGAEDDVELASGLRQFFQYGISEITTMPIFAGTDLIASVAAMELSGDADELPERPPLTASQLELLRLAAEQATPALINARLHESLQQAYHESETLRHIGQDLARSRDTHQALALACRAVYALFNADYAGVVRLMPDGSMRWESVIGNRTARHASGPFSPSLVRPIREGHVLVTQDFPNDVPMSVDAYPVALAEGLRSSLVVPIMVAGEPIGALAIGFRNRRPIREGDIRMGQALAHTLASAMQAITRATAGA
jgi:GAF domain-containing protein